MFKTFLKIKLIVGALIAALSFFGGAFAARSVSAESSGIAVQYDLFSAGFAGNTFSASDVFTGTLEETDGYYYFDLNYGMVSISPLYKFEREGDTTIYTIDTSTTVHSDILGFGDSYGMIVVTFRLYTRTEETNYEDLAPSRTFTYIYCGKSEYMNTDLPVGQWLQSYIIEPIPSPGHTGYLNYVAIAGVEAYDEFTTTNSSPYISIYSDNRLFEFVPSQITIYGAEQPSAGVEVRNQLNFDSALIIPQEIYDSTNQTNSFYYNDNSGYNFAYINSPSITYEYTLGGFNIGQPAPYNLTVNEIELQYGDQVVRYNVTLKPQSGWIQTPARGSDDYHDFIKSMHVVMNNAPNAPPDAPPVTPTPEPEPEPEQEINVPPNDFATWFSVVLTALIFPIIVIPLAISSIISGNPIRDTLGVVNGIRSVVVAIGDFFAPVVNFIGNIITTVVDAIGRVFEAIVEVITQVPKVIDRVVDPPFNFILLFAIIAVVIVAVAIILKKRR